MSQIDLQWFAAEDEGRTEDPTEHRLQKEREEGRVAKSQELSGMVVLLFVTLSLIAMGPYIYRQIVDIFVFFLNNASNEKVDDGRLFYLLVQTLAKTVLPLCIIGMIAGVVVNVAQTKGFLWTTKSIRFKGSNLVPHFLQYFQRTLFSRIGLFNLAKSLVKVIVIGTVSFILIRKDLSTTINFLHTAGLEFAFRRVSFMAAKLLVVNIIILLLISVADYIMQRREFIEKLKMTPYEVKQEYKELEGDPEVKGKLEQAQRELMQDIEKIVKDADVVITNPTHYAVALKREDEAPKVTAKGIDETALTIRRYAEQNDVPVINNRPLARDLYTNVDVGQMIPQVYFRTVSVVYAQIYSLLQKKVEK